MLIYPFHNDDTQSQLTTRVGRVWLQLSFERRNHGGGVADRRAKQRETLLRSEPFLSFDDKVYDV